MRILRHWLNVVLAEGRHDGISLLYHSTRTDLALTIIAQGAIQMNTDAVINGKSMRGLSLTRSRGFASVYNDVAFGFDERRIRHTFRGRLFPHADSEMGISDVMHADHRREAEEFLVARLPLHGFLVAIWLTEAGCYTPDDDERDELMSHPLYSGVLRTGALWQPGCPSE